MSREWLVARFAGQDSSEVTVYTVDGGPVTVDDLNWIIARLRPDDEPMSTPIRPGPPTWEYSFGLANELTQEDLGPGWEPFAVVEHAGESWVHLRRRANDV